MAAGLVAEPRRRASASAGVASASASQAEWPWADALLGRLPPPLRSGRAGQKWPWADEIQRAGPVAVG